MCLCLLRRSQCMVFIVCMIRVYLYLCVCLYAAWCIFFSFAVAGGDGDVHMCMYYIYVYVCLYDAWIYIVCVRRADGDGDVCTYFYVYVYIVYEHFVCVCSRALATFPGFDQHRSGSTMSGRRCPSTRSSGFCATSPRR